MRPSNFPSKNLLLISVCGLNLLFFGHWCVFFWTSSLFAYPPHLQPTDLLTYSFNNLCGDDVGGCDARMQRIGSTSILK